MSDPQPASAPDYDRRTVSLDGIWQMHWSMAPAEEGGFGGVPFTLLVQRRRACGTDRRGALLTAVFGQQTEDSVDVAAWVDPPVSDLTLPLPPEDGVHTRRAQSYRGRLEVIGRGGTVRLTGSVSRGDAAIEVRLEWVGPLP
jgi:hypothetical protein